MRLIRSIGVVISFASLLFFGASGSLIEIIDLHAAAAHLPATDPTMQSIRQDRYGELNYQVLTANDFDAATIPRGLDYSRALATTLQALHRRAPNQSPRYVELRQIHDVTVGQALVDGQLYAFDTATGAPVSAVNAPPQRPPPSLRLLVKQVHRLWSGIFLTAAWIELACGVLLCAIAVSGFTLYFRLIARCRRWRSGGWIVTATALKWQRLLALAAAPCVLVMACTGAWIAVDSIVHSLRFAPAENTDLSAPLADDQVQSMAKTTLQALRSREPPADIRVLRLRIFGHMQQGVVITAHGEARQLVFDADSGRPASLTEAAYPRSPFPFGLQAHEMVKYLHSGYALGVAGQGIFLLSGLALTVLSISGLMVYWHAPATIPSQR